MHLFKSLVACRGEMVSTIFRLINSSAISRPVHWLMGRPDFSGASHAKTSNWQRCSAVIFGGAPGRGRSSNRSSTLNSSSGIGSSSSHLSRHWLTVFRVTPSIRAIAELLSPCTDNNIMRARCPICCRVLCAFSSVFNPFLASSDNMISFNDRPGTLASFRLSSMTGILSNQHKICTFIYATVY